MNAFRSRPNKTREPSPSGRFSSFSRPAERGNALLYVFLAVGLLAALTYAYTKDSRENYSAQSGVRLAEELAAQINMIKAAVVQCTLEYPGGGGDMDNSGVINYSDNPNNPYPINPSSALILRAPAGCTATSNADGCLAAAADDDVRNLVCVGAPIGEAAIFQGANNQGRFLPPPPAGFSEWVYVNDTSGSPAPNGKGVYIRITAPDDAAAVQALDRLMSKFSADQADLNYGGCGARCFTAWILRNPGA